MQKPLTGKVVLVAGGTMANVLGLAVARHAKAGFDLRAEGLQGGRPRMLLYGSSETHGWVKKGAELLGLGSSAFRAVGVDADDRVDVRAMRAAIRADRAAGHHPFCVIGTAGTVNTGATDDLRALAALCRDEGLWFHVDGAFGALARLSDELAPIENACRAQLYDFSALSEAIAGASHSGVIGRATPARPPRLAAPLRPKRRR